MGNSLNKPNCVSAILIKLMRIHNFYIENPIGDAENITVSDVDLRHQLIDVFRLNVGSQIMLLDNTGYQFLSEIISYTKRDLTLGIVSKTKNEWLPRVEARLFQSIIKKDKFEWVLEKGTELGVSHFVPILAARSEKKKINLERAEKIIKEASEQSGRGTMPTIVAAATLDNALSDCGANFFVFDKSGEKLSSDDLSSDSPVSLFIGPEGGWSESDIALFRKSGAKIRTLGELTLRSETAAISALALILL